MGDVAYFAITNRHDLKKNILNFNTINYKNVRCLFYYHPGYVIKNKIEWKEYILKLIENDNLTMETGRNGLDFCLKKKEEFEEYFKKYLNSVL